VCGGRCPRSKFLDTVCVGDAGYTLSLWVNFENVTSPRPYVYMSNGGHVTSSHGVALLHDSSGNLEVTRRCRNRNIFF